MKKSSASREKGKGKGEEVIVGCAHACRTGLEEES
jgi:hypothetical protein